MTKPKNITDGVHSVTFRAIISSKKGSLDFCAGDGGGGFLAVEVSETDIEAFRKLIDFRGKVLFVTIVEGK